MPVYLFETAPIGNEEADRAVRLAAVRFPELALEQHYTEHDGRGDDVWICRAPNRAGLARWLAAAGLRVRSIRHVDVCGPARGDGPM